MVDPNLTLSEVGVLWFLSESVDSGFTNSCWHCCQKDRIYGTAKSCSLFLRGGRPGAGAARITQPLRDRIPFAPELFNYD